MEDRVKHLECKNRHIGELSESVAALRLQAEALADVAIQLRDITRVVHANGYGSGGFRDEAFIRSGRADVALASWEKYKEENGVSAIDD
jgi:hypothetical protein